MKSLIDNNLMRQIDEHHYQIKPCVIGKGFYKYKKYKNGTGMGDIKDLVKKWKTGFPKLTVTREDQESIYTAKMEKSALAMLYGKTIEMEMPIRDNKNITTADSYYRYRGIENALRFNPS